MEHKCKIFKKESRQSGITLVALVVTIVILLILAGISIKLILDNNGIISKAGEAKDKYEQDETNSETRMSEMANYIKNETGKSAQTVVKAFKTGKLKVGDWVNYQNPTTVSADVKAKDSNYSNTGYTSPASRTGLSSNDSQVGLIVPGRIKLASLKNKMIGYTKLDKKIAAHVATVPWDLDQTYSLSNNGVQVNWRILGLSEDGTQLMLTTGSPLQRDYNTSKDLSEENGPYFWLRGAKGTSTEYGIAELNKICAIYKNNLASEVRSITIDDINRLCEVKVDVGNRKVTKKSDTSTNIEQYGNIGTSQTYTDQYQSPDDYINGIGTTASFSKTSNAYYYEGCDAIDSESPLYEVLCDLKLFYWLASSTTYVESDYCCWGVGCVSNEGVYSYEQMFWSDGDASGFSWRGVRPVVYLKADVTVDELQKIDTPTSGEDEW